VHGHVFASRHYARAFARRPAASKPARQRLLAISILDAFLEGHPVLTASQVRWDPEEVCGRPSQFRTRQSQPSAAQDSNHFLILRPDRPGRLPPRPVVDKPPRWWPWTAEGREHAKRPRLQPLVINRVVVPMHGQENLFAAFNRRLSRRRSAPGAPPWRCWLRRAGVPRA
jgi:hypothetical protein